jgi:ferredoxin
MVTGTDTKEEGLPPISRRGFIGSVCVAGLAAGLLLAWNGLSGSAPTSRGVGLQLAASPAESVPATDRATVDAAAGAGGQVAGRGTPKVLADKCTGCGKCVRIAPKTFALNGSTLKAYVRNPAGDPPPIILKAARACPTGAIRIE